MIKKLFYILLILTIIASVIYFAASLALKPFLLKELSKGLNGRRVEAKAVSVSFPLSLNFKNLRVFNKKEDKGLLLTAENLNIGINPFSLFNRRILLDQVVLIKPDIKTEKDSSADLNIADLLAPSKEAKPRDRKTVLIFRIEIKNGRLEFLDNTVLPRAFNGKIDNINLKIAKVHFPLTSAKTNFSLSFNLVSLANQIKGRAKTEGWINIVKKDMLADLEIENVDIVYFKPYYKKGFSYIENGILSFSSSLDSKDNDITAVCRLEASSLSFAKEVEETSNILGISLGDMIEYLKDSRGKINFSFSLRGKMDKPDELISKGANVVIKSSLQKMVYSQLQKLLQKTGEGTVNAPGKAQEKLEDIRKILEGVFKPE